MSKRRWMITLEALAECSVCTGAQQEQGQGWRQMLGKSDTRNHVSITWGCMWPFSWLWWRDAIDRWLNHSGCDILQHTAVVRTGPICSYSFLSVKTRLQVDWKLLLKRTVVYRGLGAKGGGAASTSVPQGLSDISEAHCLAPCCIDRDNLGGFGIEGSEWNKHHLSWTPLLVGIVTLLLSL